MDIQTIKNRYDIVGNDPKWVLAINKAMQVAPTDLSILVTGESGVGKDVFSKIVHDFSNRKHKKLVPVNCGAIPEGTIESELFGHIKGSFTGADRDRKGYFEEADGGTIFLDEVGELPLAMQVKLLRVLENGEILPVGSSSPKKINVRVVAATNIDIMQAVRTGRFREDLYYRLNQISIAIPPLRERKEDIYLLFRKFVSDVSDKYHMPPITLTQEAREYLEQYPWYGNIRELKNITEQIAVVETDREISRSVLESYINFTPQEMMPALNRQGDSSHGAVSDRELLLKALSMGQMINDMRNEISQLRQAVAQLAQGVSLNESLDMQAPVQMEKLEAKHEPATPSYYTQPGAAIIGAQADSTPANQLFHEAVVVEDEPLSLQDREQNAIKKALLKHRGKRKQAAHDLGISERTLYRKLKEYGIE